MVDLGYFPASGKRPQNGSSAPVGRTGAGGAGGRRGRTRSMGSSPMFVSGWPRIRTFGLRRCSTK